MNSSNPRDPHGWWKALLTLFGVGVFIVGLIAGINWAIGI